VVIDIQEIKRRLTSQNIIDILYSLGASSHEEREDYIIFPTICHNPLDCEASMKLYYYKESRAFHCYTECGDNFDIFELIERVRKVNGNEVAFYDAIEYVLNFVTYNNFTFVNEDNTYQSRIDDYEQTKEIELKPYDKKVLDTFSFYPTKEWLSEGISVRAHKKFNILYYNYQNKIIIPHYDYKGNLVGIRGRALDEDDIETYGKYAPVRVEDTIYKHPLSLNLYGLYENQNNIRQFRTAIVLEGEKSIYKYDDMYNYNIAVASCGSSLNIKQVQLLVKKFNVNNIILAYDKEYENFSSEKGKKYFEKLKQMCEKYKNYCNFSFIFDFDNLLKEKQAPIDAGKEIFEKLMKERVEIK
jgi:hypothetical protein